MLFPSSVPDTKLVLYPLQDKLTSGDKSLNLSAFKLSRLFFSFLSSGLLVVRDRWRQRGRGRGRGSEGGSTTNRAKKKGAASTASSESRNEDLLARLMVNEFIDLTQTHKERKSKNVEAFIEIKKRKVELKAEDIRIGPELEMTLDLKRAIKER
ncbi:hypothetical protein Tco_0352342 [Tanacetum coccineum]